MCLSRPGACLKNPSQLVLFTNSVKILDELEGRFPLSVVSTGGTLQHRWNALTGPYVIDFLSRVNSGEPEQRPEVHTHHITSALALSFAICAVSAAIGGSIGHTEYNILFVTIFTILVANLMPRTMATLQGEFEIGMILMYLFFAMIGSSTNFTEFAGPAVAYFFYGMVLILIHLAIVLVAARFMKVDYAEAIVASGANLVGPAVTAAIAISQGWRHLITPAIMTGVFGYVIGTFIGVAVAAFLAP